MDQPNSGNNAINNYKGVMLCSRPNQNQATTTEKPFCGRVVPREQLGLVPVKQEGKVTYQTKKPRLEILDRHKKWLDKFKKDIEGKKTQLEQNKKQEEQKFNRIKQLAQIDRQRSRKMRQQYNQTATNVLNILDGKQSSSNGNNSLTPQNLQRLNVSNNQRDEQSKKQIKSKQSPVHKKNNNQFKKKNKISKPLWAQTQEQIEKNEEQQVDQLLDFFSTNHVEDYLQDQQVKDILSNLKNKIQQMREQQNWKQKQMDKIKQKRQERKQQQNDGDDDDDKYTHFSVQSEGRSVASQKTQQKIQQLKAKKKEQQQWDKHTTSQKSSIANIDQKIAKNIADQVLRNYPNMRGVHSNTSIRKLLEAQAARVMNQPIARPVITTIIKQKQKIDANNLPYLHRNPAI